MSTQLEVLIIALLVLLNGVLAGAEIAVVAVRKTRLQQLAAEGRRTARAVLALRDNPERFLATVQVGITVISATAGAFGGAAFAKDLARILEGAPVVGPHAEGVAFAATVGVISYLSLVIGELVPKSLALRSAEPYALFIGLPLVWLATIARPLVWFLTASSNVVLKVFRDKTSFTEARLSPEELRQMVEEASRAGTLDAHAGEIASRAFDLAELSVTDVMVPRSRVVTLDRATPVAVAIERLTHTGHRRILVHDGSTDRVIGFVSLHDAVVAKAGLTLDRIVQPALFVPDSKGAVELLKNLQRRQTPLAVVIDAMGAVCGLVTLDDLMHELVGETLGNASAAPIRRQVDGSALVLGTVPIRQVNRELGFQLPELDDVTTVAGLFLALARHIPTPGETVTTHNGFTLEVIGASRRRVRTLRLLPPITSRRAAASSSHRV